MFLLAGSFGTVHRAEWHGSVSIPVPSDLEINIHIYVYIYSLLRMNQSLIPEFNCAALAILLC